MPQDNRSLAAKQPAHPALTGAATLALLAALSVSPRPAQACLPLPNATGLMAMEGRRAVIWLHETTFEMTFQNQYLGDAADFAWVIPLPGVPQLVEAEAESFLQQLDLLTSPLVEESDCVIHCHSDSGIQPGGTSTVSPTVTVWSSGQLGDLEYSVISAESSAELISWLSAHDYALSSSLQPLVDSYLEDGAAFFAAKIVAGASQPAAVPAVRFTFDRQTVPLTYPLRISSFNRQEPLNTVLWLISDDGQTLLPSNYPTAQVTESQHTLESLATAQAALMAQQGGITFVVEFADSVPGDYRREMVFYQAVGSAEQDERLSLLLQSSAKVVRLAASLNPLGTNEDLQLAAAASPVYQSGWYLTPCAERTYAPGCGPQSDLGSPPSDAGVDGLPAISSDGSPSHPADKKESSGGCQLSPAPGTLPGSLLLLGLVLGTAAGVRRRRR